MTAILAGPASAQIPGIVGIWQGTLEAGQIKMRVAFHINADADGKLTATFDSLDQNALGIPCAGVAFADNKLHVQIPAAHANYDGALNGNAITGTFTQGVALPLNLRRVDKIEMPARAQEPRPPYPYEVQEVAYENDGIHLAGTLTMPRGEGPFPAALMITGSGPQDRDETIMGHKPFLVIADYLTRRGIAVLRVDDRGVGKSTGNSTQETLQDMAGDVLAGVEFLRTRKEIDPKHIGVIGHSEGATTGTLAASRSPDIAFVIMLAGMGVSFERAVDSHESQAEIVMRQAGATDETIEVNKQIERLIFRALRAASNPSAAVEKMRSEFEKLKATLPEAQRKPLETPAAVASLNQQFTASTLPEMRSIFLDDPAEPLRKLKVPVLALNGSRDVQVSAKLNLPAIAAALAEGGNTDFTVAEMPGLNHLFQKCNKCTIAEYGDLDETFSPAALTVIGDWLVAHTH